MRAECEQRQMHIHRMAHCIQIRYHLESARKNKPTIYFFSLLPFMCNSFLDEPETHACHKLCDDAYGIFVFIFCLFRSQPMFLFRRLPFLHWEYTFVSIASHRSRRINRRFSRQHEYGMWHQHQIYIFFFFEWFYELSASFSVHCVPKQPMNERTNVHNKTKKEWNQMQSELISMWKTSLYAAVCAHVIMEMVNWKSN